MEEAKNWMEAQQGWLSFDGVCVSMQYSAPRDKRSSSRNSSTTGHVQSAACKLSDGERLALVTGLNLNDSANY